MKTNTSFFLNLFIFLLWIGLMIAGVFSSPVSALSSASTMLQFTITSAIITWPIQAGLSAFITGQYLSGGSLELILSLPFRGRIFAVAKINSSFLLSSLTGFYCSALTALTVAYSQGSLIAINDLLILIPLTTGTISVTFLGIASSTLLRFKLISPVLTLVLWLLITTDNRLSNHIWGYITASPFGLYTLTPNSSQILSNSLLFCGVIFLATVVISLRLFTCRMVVLSGFTATVAFLTAIILAPAQPIWFQTLDSQDLVCKQLNHYSYCVISEQTATLPQVGKALKPLVSRFISIYEQKKSYRFSPVPSEAQDIEIPVYLKGMQNYKSDLAASLATHLLQCPYNDKNGITAEINFESAPFAELLAFLLNEQIEPVPGEVIIPPATETMRDLLRNHYETHCSVYQK